MNGQLLIDNEVSLRDWNHPFEYYFGSLSNKRVDSKKTDELKMADQTEKPGPNYFLVGGPYPNYQPK